MGMRNKIAGGSAGMLASGVGLGYAAKKVLDQAMTLKSAY